MVLYCIEVYTTYLHHLQSANVNPEMVMTFASMKEKSFTSKRWIHGINYCRDRGMAGGGSSLTTSLRTMINIYYMVRRKRKELYPG